MTFLIIFAILKFIDVYSTWLCLKKPDNVEKNGILSKLISKYGAEKVLITEFFVVVTPLAIFAQVIPWAAWFVFIGLQGLVAVNNIRAYRGQSTLF